MTSLTYQLIMLSTSCALNLISTFLILSLGRYHCWWTISPQGHGSYIYQCRCTDI